MTTSPTPNLPGMTPDIRMTLCSVLHLVGMTGAYRMKSRQDMVPISQIVYSKPDPESLRQAQQLLNERRAALPVTVSEYRLQGAMNTTLYLVKERPETVMAVEQAGKHKVLARISNVFEIDLNQYHIQDGSLWKGASRVLTTLNPVERSFLTGIGVRQAS